MTHPLAEELLGECETLLIHLWKPYQVAIICNCHGISQGRMLSWYHLTCILCCGVEVMEGLQGTRLCAGFECHVAVLPRVWTVETLAHFTHYVPGERGR